jgi:hypothetical protein
MFVPAMQAVIPILSRVTRHLFTALAAHVQGDAAAVEAALERADRCSSDLIDAVGGADAMGTRIGDYAMCLYSDIESIELDGEHAAVFNAIGAAIGAAVKVAAIANGPNPFERMAGWEDFDPGAVDVPTPTEIVRA